MRILIVDDESPARENLRRKLAKLPFDFCLIQEADNIIEAQKQIKDFEPELVFLDIHMPGGSGFDLLDQFEVIDFEIIFVTAYDEYALEAFDKLAIGYLLKPIDEDKLTNILNKLMLKGSHKDTSNQIQLLKRFLDRNNDSKRLGIPVENGIEVISTSDLMYLESIEGYTIIWLLDGSKILSSKRLIYFEPMLPKDTFIRIHRAFIVNINFVSKYLKSGEVVLRNEKFLTVSKRMKKEVAELLRGPF